MALESENTWHVLGTEVSRRHGCLRTEGRMRAPSLGAEAQVLSVRGSEGLLSLFAVCGWEGAGGGAVDPHLSRKGFSDWWWGLRPCVKSRPVPEDSSPVVTWFLGYFLSLPRGVSPLLSGIMQERLPPELQ